MSRVLGDRSEMGTAAIRTDRTDLSARAVYEACKRRQATGHPLETYGDTPGAGAGGGHSRDAGHGDCARTPRKVRACGAPDGWRAMPARRRVGALCGKLGIDPTDLSLLGEQGDVPT